VAAGVGDRDGDVDAQFGGRGAGRGDQGARGLGRNGGLVDGGGEMRLTEQGRVLLDYAQRAFDLPDEAEAQVGADQAALAGTIRIGAPSDLARNVLPPWFDDFMGLHPDVQLQLHVGDRPKDVVRDEVDLALRYGVLADFLAHRFTQAER
jgi:DNA-binding transcriptional LysR family regulator